MKFSFSLREALLALRRLAVLFILLVAWELLARNRFINPVLFPAPSVIVEAIVDGFRDGDLIRHILASLGRVVVGTLLAIVAGVGLGTVLARFPKADFHLAPIIEILRPISVIAWIPLAIIWFGLGNGSAWFIIALGAFFPIFSNAYHGMKSVSDVHLKAAQTLGFSPWRTLRYVLLPSSLPDLLTGIRVGLGLGWACVVAAEMISSVSGLGYLIQTARTLMETERIYAGMIVIGVIGFFMNYGMSWLGRRAAPWLVRSSR